jgi:hypothetical protein
VVHWVYQCEANKIDNFVRIFRIFVIFGLKCETDSEDREVTSIMCRLQNDADAIAPILVQRDLSLLDQSPEPERFPNPRSRKTFENFDGSRSYLRHWGQVARKSHPAR